MEMTFIAVDGGDSSVGIFPLHAEITVKDNNLALEDGIEAWRLMLADMYDIPASHVFTAAELNAEISKEDSFYQQYIKEEFEKYA